MSQNTTPDAEQNDEELIGRDDYVRISDDVSTFPGRVGQVQNVERVDGTEVYTVDVQGSREVQNYTREHMDRLGEWAAVASSRVRAFVADARHAEQVGTPTVEKAGDVGAILSVEFEGGRMSGRVFEVADRYGFEVAEVNFSEETVLFQDPALAE